MLGLTTSHPLQRSKLSGQHSARVTRAAREGVAAAGKGAAGRENLMNLIKNYMRNQGIKTAVSVGVIGYPNVGKSSIINSLTFSKSVGVSPKPGYTTMTQVRPCLLGVPNAACVCKEAMQLNPAYMLWLGLLCRRCPWRPRSS